jgi:tripartite-type tricarboxylate transporter receptor subunit TctC
MPASGMLSRRLILAILDTAFAPVGRGWAQGGSRQIIRFIVPFTAGTGPDLLARILGEELKQR